MSSLTQGLLSFDHGLDTVVHVLNEGGLGATESADVGDVVDVVVGLGVLAVSTANLHEVLVSNSLESFLVLTQVGEVDVDGGTEGSAKIRGARSDVAEVVVAGELSDLLDSGGSVAQSLEDSEDVGTRLHRNDTELVLLVDPGEEGLVSIVEDTTTLGPVAIASAGLEEAVSLLEEEVVLNKLLALSVSHLTKLVVLAGKLPLERGESLLSGFLDCVALLAGDAGGERVGLEVAADADAGAADHLGVLGVEGRAVELGVVHVADVLGVLSVSVVGLDDLVEEGRELVVAGVGAGVSTDARVNVLAAREDADGEGDANVVLDVLELFPDISGEVLREQALGAFGEDGEASDLFGGLEVRAALNVGALHL